MKQILFLLAMVMAVTAGAANRLSIADFNIKGGETKTVNVALDNTDTFYGVQFELPAGLTLNATAVGTRCNKHVISTNTLSDGSVRVWVSSQASRAINGTSGTLLTLTLKAAAGFSGTRQLWLRNIVCAKENASSSGERVSLSDYCCMVNPGSTATGDVTGDGKVDVEDVNAVINVILKLNTATDYPGKADVTGDGKIDVEDVNAIINIILKV